MASKELPLSRILTALSCVVLTLFAAYMFWLGRRGVAYSTIGAEIIVIRWSWLRPKVSAWALFPAAFLVLFYATRVNLLGQVAPVRESWTFDVYALYVDGSFGFQPSVLVHSLVAKSVISEFLFQAVYEALPIAIAVAYAFNLEGRRRWRIFGMMVLVAVIGVQCYKLFPICGPAYLPFGNDCFYYRGSCSVSAFFNGTPYMISISDQWARNGMPSLHMTWALLSWWSCRNRPVLRWIMLAFAVLTAFATLAYGEHYLIDLAAACPFSIAIWFLCMGERPFSNPARILPIIGGALGYMAWIWAVRFSPTLFYSAAVILWTAFFASLAYLLALREPALQA